MVMRRVSNLLLTTREAGLVYPRDADEQIGRTEIPEHSAALACDVNSANGREMACDARRLVDDLSHDLRQPLSSIHLNLQSAIRCLRFREPSVSLALEALTECLDVEGELVRLVARLQQQLADAMPDPHWLSLNDLARDACESLMAVGFGPRRVAQRLADPPPYVNGVDVGALHKGVLGIGSRLLAQTDRNSSASDADALIIETRQTAEQAELRLGRIACDMPKDIQSVLDSARGIARRSQAEASIELGPTMAAIVISFPARTRSRRRAVRRSSDGA
jgi:hypothetical protein